MEFQLSDAVLQSIFEPIIVTDAKGHLLKVNQAATELLGRGRRRGDRMALNNTPRRREDSERDIRDGGFAAERRWPRRMMQRCLPLRFGNNERSFRLRTTPMRDSEGRLLGTVTTLEGRDVSLQNTDRFKTQFIAVASPQAPRPRCCKLRRGLYCAGQRILRGELTSLQSELVAAASDESQKLDDLMGGFD